MNLRTVLGQTAENQQILPPESEIPNLK